MSDSHEGGAAASTPAPAKKSKKSLLLIIVAVLVVAAGAGGFFVYRTRAAAASAKEADKEKSASKKSAKNHSKKKDEEDGAEEAENDEEDVKEVVELQPFIVNLTDEQDARYLRMTVSLGLATEGGGEAKPDPLYTTKVRNALLNVLTTKRSQDVLTSEGKTQLRKQLLAAARAAVDEPHVSAIYITDFIVQL